MTSIYDELPGFITARLDDAELAYRLVSAARSRAGQALRDIAAKREIVRRCAVRMNEMDIYPNGLVSPRAVLARQVLLAFAAVWEDHRDYNPEWKP